MRLEALEMYKTMQWLQQKTGSALSLTWLHFILLITISSIQVSFNWFFRAHCQRLCFRYWNDNHQWQPRRSQLLHYVWVLRNGRSIKHETRPDRSKRLWLVRKTPCMESWGQEKSKAGRWSIPWTGSAGDSGHYWSVDWCVAHGGWDTETLTTG